METKTGKVVEVRADGATIEFEDGSRETVVAAPVEEILIEVGMSVSVADTEDGKPVYAWGVPAAQT
jgi:hypothetical protein